MGAVGSVVLEHLVAKDSVEEMMLAMSNQSSSSNPLIQTNTVATVTYNGKRKRSEDRNVETKVHYLLKNLRYIRPQSKVQSNHHQSGLLKVSLGKKSGVIVESDAKSECSLKQVAKEKKVVRFSCKPKGTVEDDAISKSLLNQVVKEKKIVRFCVKSKPTEESVDNSESLPE